MRIRSGYARVDVTRGRYAVARRLDGGGRVWVDLTVELDPDPRARSDDGTSVDFSGNVLTAHVRTEEGEGR